LLMLCRSLCGRAADAKTNTIQANSSSTGWKCRLSQPPTENVSTDPKFITAACIASNLRPLWTARVYCLSPTRVRCPMPSSQHGWSRLSRNHLNLSERTTSSHKDTIRGTYPGTKETQLHPLARSRSRRKLFQKMENLVWRMPWNVQGWYYAAE
jgi:hypothetical protein